MERKAVLVLTSLVVLFVSFGFVAPALACDRGEREMVIKDDFSGKQYRSCYVLGYDDTRYLFVGPTEWDVWGAVDLSEIIGTDETDSGTCVFSVEEVTHAEDRTDRCSFTADAPGSLGVDEDLGQLRWSQKLLDRGVEVKVHLTESERETRLNDVNVSYGSELKFRTKDGGLYTGTSASDALGSRTIVINTSVPRYR